MSIQTEITRLQGLKAAIRSKLVAMGIISSGQQLWKSAKMRSKGSQTTGRSIKRYPKKPIHIQSRKEITMDLDQ